MSGSEWDDDEARAALQKLRWRNEIVALRQDIFFRDRHLADLEEAFRVAASLRDWARFEAALSAYDDYVHQVMRNR